MTEEMRNGPPVVLKAGGEAAATADARARLAANVAALRAAGRAVVLVHGGGPQATALSRRLGIEPRLVGGRRITDAATLDVMKMVLAGLLSVDLTAALQAAGVAAVGISGVSAGLIEAVRRPPRAYSGTGGVVDFGLVGDIVGIGTTLLARLTGDGLVPVVNSLGIDRAGQVYNINADVAATRIAAAVGAQALVLLTAAPGVLRRRDDPASRIPHLTVAEARRLIAEGVVAGGMIPKLEESFEALAAGVQAVHVLALTHEQTVAEALARPGCHGTVLTAD